MRLAAVVLAAGASTRLQEPKQLVALGGETLLHRTARLALEAGFDPVRVVVGYRGEEMAAALQGLAVEVVPNGAWAEGMAASIRAGIAGLPEGLAGAALLVCDQPGLDAALLGDLRRVFEAEPQARAACRYGGATGVPAVFPAGDFPVLAALQGDRGARSLLGTARTVDFPGGAADLDTPGDLARLRGMHPR